LDVPVAKIVFHDLQIGSLHDDFDDFKKLGNRERALRITPLDAGAYRFSLQYRENGQDWQRLFFDLPRMGIRCLSRTVLDYLSNHELAAAIVGVMTPGAEAMTTDKHNHQQGVKNAVAGFMSKHSN